MNLHRADKPGWEKRKPENWNLWQRMAARTNGIAAPANFVSVVGALIVIWGLYLVASGSLLVGALVILAGRAADILDGMVAEYTDTKSALGEAVDATIDKIIIFLSLLVLYGQHLVPVPALLAVLVFSLYNTALSLYVRRKKRELHPSLTGKLSTAFAWVALVVYILKADIDSHAATSFLDWTAATSFSLFIIFSAIAGIGYTKHALNKE